MNTLINILEKEKVFFWTPPKTASTHAARVLSFFDVKAYYFNGDKVEKITEFKHSHAQSLFIGHENYKLVCTARNPFTRLISLFKHENQRNKFLTEKEFKLFFRKSVEENQLKSYFQFSKGNSRKPDYFLRCEHLWSDYTKIDFIRTSKIYSSGVLYDFCQKKINYLDLDSSLVKNFYTTDMIDLVYEQVGDYMKLLNYEYPF